MFKTKTLSSFKSIFPPIHQPLPLDKRESKKLLDALTTSFRIHLDREHEPLSKPTTLQSTPAVKYLPSTERPTDRHLRSILSNPLFGRIDLAASPATEPSLAESISLSRLASTHKDVFERAVAKGLMTIPRAHGFLLRVAKDIRDSSTVSVSQGLRESGAGLLVVQWLRASGQERELSFLSHERFTQDLVRFMVAEGLDELVWNWLQRLIYGSGEFAVGNPTYSSALLKSLVKAQWASGGLDKAYSSVSKADSMLRERSLQPKLLSWAWINVARKTTIDSWGHKAPAVDIFESFLGVGKRIPTPHALEEAHLDLYHPTKPSPDRAIKLLSVDGIGRQLNLYKHYNSFSKLLKLLSFDTLQHLVKAGEVQEAERVLDRLGVLLPQLNLHDSVRAEFEAAMRGFRS